MFLQKYRQIRFRLQKCTRCFGSEAGRASCLTRSGFGGEFGTQEERLNSQERLGEWSNGERMRWLAEG